MATTTMNDAEPQARRRPYRSRSLPTVSSARASRVGAMPAKAPDITASASAIAAKPSTSASPTAPAAAPSAAAGMTRGEPG